MRLCGSFRLALRCMLLTTTKTCFTCLSNAKQIFEITGDFFGNFYACSVHVQQNKIDIHVYS